MENITAERWLHLCGISGVFFLKVVLDAQRLHIEYILRDCNFPYIAGVMASEMFLQTEYIDK
jgi:hypothetical protein